MRGRRWLWLLFVASACKSPTPASTWPHFPAKPEQRAELTKQFTRREAKSLDLTPESVFVAGEKAGWHTLPSGSTAVREQIDARAKKWLLFGSFHDSAGQLEAFRKFIGPDGIAFTHVVLEQLRADGHWSDVDAAQQLGDSQLLTRALSTSNRAEWRDLARAHAAHDYTAWKYDYTSGVLDVVATAKAMSATPLGCDLPDSLLARLPNGTDDDVLRLRELHCWLAMKDTLTPSSRVAMFWGQAHARAEGFRRYLPPGDGVLAVFAVGQRHSETADDEQLRDRLILNDPVLVPLGGDEAALLLPDAWLGGNVARVRTEERPKETGLRVSATTPGVFTLGSRRVELSEGDVLLSLQPGTYTYCFESSGLRVVGSLELHANALAEVSFDVPTRATQLVFTE
ncbi:MAG: hypothetical protein QM817_37945 [Archangium sp.]